MVEEGIEQELARTGEYMTTTVGHSMRPMLRDRRDSVVIRAVEGELRRGDVALYRVPGERRYLLHRVIAVTETEYRIAGDNTETLERVPKDWVIGVADGFYRGERWVSPQNRWYRLYSGFVVRTSAVRRWRKKMIGRLRAWGGTRKRRIKNFLKK